MLLSTNSGFHSARPDKPRYDMIDETVDVLADAGFEAIDVNFSATIRNGDGGKMARETLLDTPDGVSRLAAKLKERNLPPHTSHLPFFAYNDENDPEHDYRFEMIYRSIDASAQLGIKWAVLHIDKTVELTLKYARDICRYANGKGVGIALENLRSSTFEVLIESIDTLVAEGCMVGCCYDVGHSNLVGVTPEDALTRLGSRVVMLHLHDNYGDRDAHQAPLCGNIDWDSMMRTLARIGYAGDFNYEINSGRLPESVRKNYYAYCVDLGKWLLGIYDDEIEKMKAGN